MKKIGIVTWYDHKNFGGSLQAYALQRVLQEAGYSAHLMRYIPENFSPRQIKARIKNFVKRITRYHYDAFNGFYDIYYCMSRPYYKDTLHLANSAFDVFVCGSDQIWAPNVFDSFYFLDFVDEDKLKLAYAPSIGLNVIPEELKKKYLLLLRRLDAVSCREKQGTALIKKEFGLDAHTVLDPTFLMEKDAWLELACASKKQYGGAYIFCYFLNQTNAYHSLVKRYGVSKGVSIKCISKRLEDEQLYDDYITEAGPLEFLALLKNAECIFTDSFHGMALSMNLNKKFYVFKRFDDTDYICQNSRIYNLIDLFDIPGVLVSPEQSVESLSCDLDYSEINMRLCELRAESKQWLFSNLEREND